MLDVTSVLWRLSDGQITLYSRPALLLPVLLHPPPACCASASLHQFLTALVGAPGPSGSSSKPTAVQWHRIYSARASALAGPSSANTGLFPPAPRLFDLLPVAGLASSVLLRPPMPPAPNVNGWRRSSLPSTDGGADIVKVRASLF